MVWHLLDVNPLPALELLSIRSFRTNFGEIEIKIKQCSLKKKTNLKILSRKWQDFVSYIVISWYQCFNGSLLLWEFNGLRQNSDWYRQDVLFNYHSSQKVFVHTIGCGLIEINDFVRWNGMKCRITFSKTSSVRENAILKYKCEFGKVFVALEIVILTYSCVASDENCTNTSNFLPMYCIQISWEYSQHMMTSSNGNIFHVIWPLWEESTGHWWIPLTKASDVELWYFLWSVPEQTVEQTIETLVICDPIMLILTSL